MPVTIDGSNGITTPNLTSQNNASVANTLTVSGVPVPVSPQAFSAFRSTSAQTISSGTWTRVQLNGEDFDSNGVFDNATNFRFQPTVAGYYQFSGRVVGSASSGGTVAISALYKNGTLNVSGSTYLPPSGSSGMTSVVSGLVYLNGTTDFVELWINMTGAGSITVSAGQGSTFLQGVLVAAS